MISTSTILRFTAVLCVLPPNSYNGDYVMCSGNPKGKSRFNKFLSNIGILVKLGQSTCEPISGWNIKSKIEELIIGGDSIGIQEVPYQAALYFQSSFFCSGSIVSPTHIVTAAHCLMHLPLRHVELLNIRVGTSKMHSGGLSVQARNFSLHNKFSRSTIDYDVAVIELKIPLNFTSEIQPLKLEDTEPPQGQEVRVSGWGYIREIGPTSRKLRSVIVKVVDRKTCEMNYKGRIAITKRMICAYAENKDACYGDSGGPLVHKERLLGIVSSGEGCARKNFPGIYTTVANKEVRDFILKETGLRPKRKSTIKSLLPIFAS